MGKLTKAYYEDGQLKEDGFHKNDEFHGLSKFYSEGGHLIEESYWENNVRHGAIKTYYENGQLKFEGNMNNGQEIGLWKEYNEDGEVEEINYDSVSENEQVQIPNFLTDYSGLEGIQRYLNERVNIARIFDEVNLLLFKGEKVEVRIKNETLNYNEEQITIVKRGLFDIMQLLETLNKEENLIKRREPQLIEEFKKRNGSSKQLPEGLDIVLIPLHPEIKNTLQELIVKL